MSWNSSVVAARSRHVHGCSRAECSDLSFAVMDRTQGPASPAVDKVMDLDGGGLACHSRDPGGSPGIAFGTFFRWESNTRANSLFQT